MLAEIIAVGSEMLTPHRQDTNSLYLTAGLNDLGVTVAFKTIVGDNHDHLRSAIPIAINRADVVLLSGGLGPTEDDLTRECLAETLNLSLRRNEAVYEFLQQRFAARNMNMPPTTPSRLTRSKAPRSCPTSTAALPANGWTSPITETASS